ncbi:TIGR02281 family clan AA aspartic protease [Halopseudomonas nanhaiensis]|uniref:retropepsin-like aspartic protease family protein n=1 Tax=Halopseudomonas nanhaiensis TaxID=2830842 RepID=UPI001CBCB833|nr:TIGR02281 family clan AA aspartic protease [Halopseudomonas nanhaiensis]UAW98095.1 TIGR02281 family clan AA aspartic protease [Halopseudomonas nanhaiensis]
MKTIRLSLFACLLMLPAAGVLAAPDVRVVGLFNDAAVVTIDGQRHMLRVGRPGPQGVELLAASSRSATLRIDGQAREFGLETDYSEAYTDREKIRVSIPRGAGGHYRTNGSINGQGVAFMVDTGATSVAMNSEQARRLGVDYKLDGTPIKATTASGQVSGYRVSLARVKVGNIELSNVDGLVLEGAFPLEVLLGMSYLRRVRMEDQGTVMVLEQRY